MKSACFTGHRILIGDINGLKDCLFAKLADMACNEGYTDFYAGGALGWDMIAEESVIALKEKYHFIKLDLVLPCSSEEQTSKWNRKQKERYLRILSAADSIEYISEHYEDDCMKKRNQRLVDLSECCLCFWNEENRASGTSQTVRMALDKGIEVLNFYGSSGVRSFRLKTDKKHNVAEE